MIDKRLLEMSDKRLRVKLHCSEPKQLKMMDDLLQELAGMHGYVSTIFERDHEDNVIINESGWINLHRGLVKHDYVLFACKNQRYVEAIEEV